MTTYGKSNQGIVHLVNPLGCGEYALCGWASFNEEDPWEFCPIEKVTCEHCLGVVEFCKVVRLAPEPIKICSFTNDKIPQKVNSKVFKKNGWIAPNGNFYGCEFGQHYQTATWICAFELEIAPELPKKGDYFKPTCESLLRSKGWVAIKNHSDQIPKREFSGLDEEELQEELNAAIKIFRVDNTTEKQEGTIVKYLEFFNLSLDL